MAGHREKEEMNQTAEANLLYKKLLLEGKSPKESAKIAQERTGISLVTGRPINKDLPYKVKYVGQYK